MSEQVVVNTSEQIPFQGTDLDEQWTSVKTRLRQELGDATYNSWFGHLAMVSMEPGRVTLSVPTKFIRDWLETHYSTQIRKAWAGVDPSVERVDILVTEIRTLEARNNDARANGANGKGSVRPVSAAPAKSFPNPAIRTGNKEFDRSGSSPLDPRYTFDNFVVGKSNELAHAAARRVAEADNVPFNPLFLYGSVGLGKTHLMHAIAQEITRRDPSRKVLYLSADQFMYQFIRAVRYKDTMAFKQKFRTVDVLMVDDVQFISGKESTQEEFFHTFNALIDHNRQVIISADRSPSDLEGIEERIRSRLGWGLSADIHATDYELRLGILQSKAELLARKPGAVHLPEKVLEFLAHKIVSNVRELEGGLNRVVAYADLVGRPVSLEMAQDVLSDLLRANERRITIDDIQRRVAEYYNLRLADLLSARRARVVARPRQVAMYLSKQLTTRSLPEIGRKFGGRDHTTVMHAVRRIEELQLADTTIREDVDMLSRMLEN
ncbi:MAG: chromosomal replication initiator protein DnaA [Alphaproteobacteria bacterium]|nr:MAG: chromosomal replication initiator protein DnaA [Alphaproteobacteria bacterium]